MAERVFTVFDGPDAGRQFTLGDAPLSLGRDAARDVVLRDERASRLHATLAADGDRVILVDQNSSNGTFLNGRLVERAEVRPGDVITLAATQIVFGREAPSPERLRVLAGMRLAHAQREEGIGSSTLVLPKDVAAATGRIVFRPLEVLHAAARGLASDAASRSITVAVEMEADSERAIEAYAEPGVLCEALAELLHLLLPLFPPGEGVLALRLGADPSQGGARVNVLSVGLKTPRTRIEASEAAGAFRRVAEQLAAAGCLLRLLPADDADVAARIHLPPPPTQAAPDTGQGAP